MEFSFLGKLSRHERINKEGLAGHLDAKLTTAGCAHWTVLLSLGRGCSPFSSTFVFRERFLEGDRRAQVPGLIRKELLWGKA